MTTFSSGTNISLQTVPCSYATIPIVAEGPYVAQALPLHSKPIGLHRNLQELQRWWQERKGHDNFDHHLHLQEVRQKRHQLMEKVFVLQSSPELSELSENEKESWELILESAAEISEALEPRTSLWEKQCIEPFVEEPEISEELATAAAAADQESDELERSLQQIVNDSVSNLTWATKLLYKYRSLRQVREQLQHLSAEEDALSECFQHLPTETLPKPARQESEIFVATPTPLQCVSASVPMLQMLESTLKAGFCDGNGDGQQSYVHAGLKLQTGKPRIQENWISRPSSGSSNIRWPPNCNPHYGDNYCDMAGVRVFEQVVADSAPNSESMGESDNSLTGKDCHQEVIRPKSSEMMGRHHETHRVQLPKTQTENVTPEKRQSFSPETFKTDTNLESAQIPNLLTLPLLMLQSKSDTISAVPTTKQDSVAFVIYFHWNHNLKEFGIEKQDAAGIDTKLELLDKAMRTILQYPTDWRVRAEAGDLSEDLFDQLTEEETICLQIWPRHTPVNVNKVKFVVLVPRQLSSAVYEDKLREGLYYLRNIMQMPENQICLFLV